MQPKQGVLILECLNKSDPGSEGRCLSHMFNLMKIPNQYLEIQTLYQFISLMKRSPYEIIHITTHGIKDNGQFVGFWTKNGILTKKKLNYLKNKLKGYSVVTTACSSGDSDFRESFEDVTSCKYFVATNKDVRFYNSIFFCNIFYYYLFIRKKDIPKILDFYNTKFKNPHEFDYL